MMKRIKKPPVLMEQRHDWLRRNEDFGETPPMIAKKDHFDVRTVRTQLERARQERDQKQARISFVKDNMEKHHQDICNLADNLLSQLNGERELDLDYSEDLYLEAMRQHLPRSPLWNKIKSWNNTLIHIEKIREDVRKRLFASLEKTELGRINSDGAEGVVKASVDVLAHQFEKWARGDAGLDMKKDWIIENRKDGIIDVRYGFSHFGWIQESDLIAIQKIIGSYENRLIKWPQYQEAEKQNKILRELGKSIRFELKGIIVRRVLPGSCAYCPI